MGQDIVADGLNQIMNAKKSRHGSLILQKKSKLLINILNLAKTAGYLNFSEEGKKLKIEIKNLNEIKAIKPRYTVPVDKINSYVRRFLPAKNFGFVIVSTNKGLMTHSEAEEKNIGGCLIAYIF